MAKERSGVNGKTDLFNYMKKIIIIPVLVGFSLGLIAMFTMGLSNLKLAYGQDQMMPDQNNPQGQDQTATSTYVNANDVDKHYLQQMAYRAQEVVSIADQAQQKIQNQEVIQIASQSKSDHENLINQIGQLYRQLYNTDLPQATSTPGSDSNSSGTSTMPNQNPNESPDKIFFEQLMPHHQMVIMVSNMMLDAYPREEVRSLAENIIQTEKSELDNMRRVYFNAYPQQ